MGEGSRGDLGPGGTVLPHGQLAVEAVAKPRLPGTVPVSAPTVLSTLGWSVTPMPTHSPYFLDSQV